MKVLLTGGNGLLGHNIIKKLIADRHHINAIVRRPKSILLEHPDLKVMEGSFANYDRLMECTIGCDAIIHVAAATDMSLDYHEFEAVNLKGSENVLRVADTLGIKRIVYISTLNTIGYGTATNHATEEAEIEYPFSESYYAITKKMAEDLFIQTSKKADSHIVIINPGYMIGAYDTKPSSGQMLMMAYKKPIMAAPMGGKCFVHVTDVATAAVNALTMGRNGNRYIAANHNMTIIDFYRLQKKVCKYHQIVLPIPTTITNLVGKLGDIVRKMGIKTQVCSINTKQLCIKEYYNSTKAQQELNMPNTPMEQAIQDFADWQYGKKK